MTELDTGADDSGAATTNPNETGVDTTEFNAEVARQFRHAADLLETQNADLFRVNAYRRAASSVEAMEECLADVYEQGGTAALVALPTIGRALAMAIADLVETGRWRWLDRLQGEVDPEAMLATVAGIGEGLAKMIHERLGIETLEDLEAAAHDGRLASVEGFGPKRVRSVADSLAGRLQQRRTTARVAATPVQPATDELLEIDSEYRSKAAAGLLPVIAPRRFNPTHEAWLPILHTVRDGQRYTAIFSNTARAHQLGRTGDWVVIYADAPGDGQWTVVTEHRGPQAGRRVVRGRESGHE